MMYNMIDRQKQIKQKLSEEKLSKQKFLERIQKKIMTNVKCTLLINDQTTKQQFISPLKSTKKQKQKPFTI